MTRVPVRSDILRRIDEYVEIPAEEVVPGDVILLQAGSPGPP